MAKYVITTTQTVVRKYYVEVDDPEWAHDGIVMGDMQEFSQLFASEDIIDTVPVDQFPAVDKYYNINGAVMVFNYENDDWDTDVRWDLS